MSSNGLLPQSELAPIKGGELAKEAAAGWNAMNVEARNRGLELLPEGPLGSYRNLAGQQQLWNAYVNGTGNLAARPGSSNHGWGNAVDIASPNQRALLDEIGAKYGWSKSWSDAPSEWWHIVYQSGHYHGPDPGPDGTQASAQLPVLSTSSATALNADGRLETFAMLSTGYVVRLAQKAVGGTWTDLWIPIGKPGHGSLSAAVNKDGRLELFVHTDQGDVKHIAQDHANADWWRDKKGNYNWLGLGNPGK